MLVPKFMYFGLRQKKGKGKGSAETAVPRLNHGGAILIQENLIGQQGLERQRRSERNEFLADGTPRSVQHRCSLILILKLMLTPALASKSSRDFLPLCVCICMNRMQI